MNTTQKTFRKIGNVVISILTILSLPSAALAGDAVLRNSQLSVTAKQRDGSYQIAERAQGRPVFNSIVAAKIDGQWVKSTDYPKHEVSQSRFEDVLGRGRQVTVVATGLALQADLAYILRLYDESPYGDITVEVRNRAGKTVTVQSLRSVESIGERALDLGGADGDDRVLPETFSTDTTTQRIYDLEQASRGTQRAISSQLVYNLQSKRSLFLGTLSAERFATILRLETNGPSGAARITSLTVDSTGTKEVLLTAESSNLKVMPEKNRIELSTPVAPGKSLASERLMFAAGDDYHAQLEAYGAAMHKLLSPPTTAECEFGWFSAKTYDKDITASYIMSNAQWFSQHLRSAGFDCFHIEPGYYYAPGEFATPNKTQFPQGVRRVTQEIARLGFKVSGFVTPIEISTDSWVYENHKEWLVHNADGEPIRLVNKQGGTFALDVTHPGAQEYIRQTYRTLGKEWGMHIIDVDGMDHHAIEGYYYRPNTSALEATKIALKLIREAVGPDVILVADGAPYLGVAGLVEFAHISQDTSHLFASTKETALGIAGHYYTHRNFWINHPDAFSVQEQPVPVLDGPKDQIPPPLPLDEARASIVLVAVSGGKYDIGDDLPTLGAEPERLALVTNPNLLQMAKLGRVSKPLDLMTYRPEDEQPSIFLLHEDARQSMLAVFNWTDQLKSHSFVFSDLQLPRGHTYKVVDALEEDRPMPLEGDTLRLNEQPARSVRLVKIIDESIPAAAPTITARAPTIAKVREDVTFSANAAEDGVPALAYHWDFGDGTSADGATQNHTYTLAGAYTAQLTVDGVDGIPAQKSFSIVVDGLQEIGPPQRYVEPNN